MSDSQIQIFPTTNNQIESSYEIKLLYDGECPLCMREVNFLRRKDNGRGKVVFVDIAEDNYSAETNGGIDYKTAMGSIHAILADGTIINGIEVFRQVYQILGMGWVYSFTKIPLIGWIADKLYKIWAALRLKITGRPSLEIITSARDKGLCSNQQKCKL